MVIILMVMYSVGKDVLWLLRGMYSFVTWHKFNDGNYSNLV